MLSTHPHMSCTSTSSSQTLSCSQSPCLQPFCQLQRLWMSQAAGGSHLLCSLWESCSHSTSILPHCTLPSHCSNMSHGLWTLCLECWTSSRTSRSTCCCLSCCWSSWLSLLEMHSCERTCLYCSHMRTNLCQTHSCMHLSLALRSAASQSLLALAIWASHCLTWRMTALSWMSQQMCLCS